MNISAKSERLDFGLSEVINLNKVERNYLKFSEEAYHLIQTNSRLCAFLYEEADTLTKIIILSLKTSEPTDVNAAF